MTEVTHLLGKPDEKLIRLLRQSKRINWCCQTCRHPQSSDILPLLNGRPIVMGTDQDGVWEELIMCSHCMFHQVNCRTRQSTASFSELGAPLDQDSGNAFIRMMCHPNTDRLMIIVL